MGLGLTVLFWIVAWVIASGLAAVVIFVLALLARVPKPLAAGLAWFGGWGVLWYPGWLYLLSPILMWSSGPAFDGCCHTRPFLTGSPTGTGIWFCSVWEWRLERLMLHLNDALTAFSVFGPWLQSMLLLYAAMFAWLIGFRHSSTTEIADRGRRLATR